MRLGRRAEENYDVCEELVNYMILHHINTYVCYGIGLGPHATLRL